MADPPSENDEAPPQPAADAEASVVSEDTATANAPPSFAPNYQQQQWQWHAPQQHPAVAMAQYYEAQMRDHAAAYASAAAGAAWAASQIAASSNMPPALPPPPIMYGGYEQQPQQQQQPWHPPPQVSEEHARPGKRQQTMPAGDAAVWQQQQQRFPSRQRQEQSSAKRGRRRMRPDTNSSDNSSRSSGRPHQRKRSTERTLLGKTGVSAIHEWCAKMKLPLPQFILEPPDQDGFVMEVKVDGKELGRGRGATKGIAKQEAARQAMQSLLPGVVFDAHGLLVELPTSSSLGDLAPNLASRLAIGEESSKKRQPSSRTWDVYPGTSTTSEEDNDYLASRGASVCSALLHALWQIDDGIPEPPSYTYEVCAAEAKRKSAAGKSAIAVRRSSFACTARLIVKRPLLSERDAATTESVEAKTETAATVQAEAKEDTDNTEEKDQFHVETLTAVGTAASKREARHAASAKLLALLFPDCNGLVEVKAAAEAVREKYAADKALALQSRRTVTLEKRRKFNEAPASNLPRKRSSIDFSIPGENDPPLPEDLVQHFRSILGQGALADEEDKASADDDVVSVESLSLSDKAVPRENKKPSAVINVEESLSRSLSRKKQLDERVDAALQIMNELDEEGRSLPEQLTSNDVGRTVLRRAESEDAAWIQRLLANRGSHTNSSSRRNEVHDGSTLDPFSLLGVLPPSPSSYRAELDDANDGNESLAMPSRLWGSTAITLLLCRVISPKADPPLGCAVLTLGFSMEKGPTLRIAELVSEPHLPKERFIECLGRFASNMKCSLDNEMATAPGVASRAAPVYSTEELKSIVEAHLACRIGAKEPPAEHSPEGDKPQSGILDLKTIGTSLQSVQEEEGEAEDDKEHKEDQKPGADDERKADKPCKRSRVV